MSLRSRVRRPPPSHARRQSRRTMALRQLHASRSGLSSDASPESADAPLRLAKSDYSSPHSASATEHLSKSLSCVGLMPSTSQETLLYTQSRLGEVLQAIQAIKSSPPRVVYRARRRSLEAKLATPQQPAVVSTTVDRGVHYNPMSFANFLIAERDISVNAHYIDGIQRDLKINHRDITIEWLLDVSRECSSEPSVLPLAVNLLDRFLSTKLIFKEDLQAVAGTCYFIASKLKEPTPLHARKMSDLTDFSVSARAILGWEIFICQHLDWMLCTPTAVDFFDIIVANQQSLACVRPAFISVLHKMQRALKLAAFTPSLQAALALLYASHGSDLFEIAKNCVVQFFPIDLNMLMPYLADIDVYCNNSLGHRSTPPSAPPSTEERVTPEISPGFEALLIAATYHSFPPATPLNDSGFCSSIGSTGGSPEAASKLNASCTDDECSPPKIRRSNAF